MPGRIRQATKDYIKAHLDEYPRKQMAMKLGIKVASLYKYIRLYGGTIKEGDQYAELRTKIKTMYPKMTANEIAQELGLTKSQIQWQATKMGLKHDNATIDRINAERNSILRSYWDAEKYAKKGRKHHLLHKRDEMLVLSGMSQKTKLRIKKMTAKALNAKMYLKKRYNYFYLEGEPLILCFDEDTTRCKREQYYTEKFGFQFINSLN